MPYSIQLGTGVRVAGTQIYPRLQPDHFGSARPAIEGQAFFHVEQPDGTMAHTRNGQFHLNSSGQMVTANGFPRELVIEVPEYAMSMPIGAIAGSAPPLPEHLRPLMGLWTQPVLHRSGLVSEQLENG
ncbi:MAG: hypothetical protein ACPG5T_03160 [Endozoicomonas sp.]